MAENKTETKKRGRESYNSTVLWAKREQRRDEAAVRDQEHNKLSLKEKMEKAKSRRGESKKELARLEKQLATQKAAPPKPQPLTEVQKSEKAVKRAQDAAASVPRTKKTKKSA